jgi:hypothetical protein
VKPSLSRTPGASRRVLVSCEAVSKELKRLERGGVIVRGRATIHVVRDGVLRQEIADWNDEPTAVPNLP